MRNIAGLYVVVLLMVSVFSANTMAQQTAVDDTQDASTEKRQRRAYEIERQPIPDFEELGVVRRSIIIVDDAQRVASERFGNFMGQVDGFFSNAGSDDDAVSNESWARIRFDGVRANGEDFEFDPSLKLRAVLPQTERKLKLLISTEDDDSEDADDGQSVTNQSNKRQNASFALRFIRSAKQNSDVNIDVGIRKRDNEIQYFGRLNTRYRLDMGEKWVANAANSYHHYSKSGYENRLSFDFRRLLYRRDDLFFRTYTEFNWEKGQKGSVIGHTTGLYWKLSGLRSFALEGLASYHTSLNPGINDRFRGHEIRIRWRHNIWRPWFFYEIWPSLAWPSSTKYKKTQGFLLRAEVIIGQPG